MLLIKNFIGFLRDGQHYHDLPFVHVISKYQLYKNLIYCTELDLVCCNSQVGKVLSLQSSPTNLLFFLFAKFR